MINYDNDIVKMIGSLIHCGSMRLKNVTCAKQKSKLKSVQLKIIKFCNLKQLKLIKNVIKTIKKFNPAKMSRYDYILNRCKMPTQHPCKMPTNEKAAN